MPTDAELMVEYANSRTAEAFAVLVERYQQLVLATCRRRLHSAGDLDDAVQETFLRLAKSAAPRRANLGAWLYRCAVNVASDHNRRRGTRDRYESTAAKAEAITDTGRELAELREHLDMAIAKLDDAQRELIVQRFFVGRSQADLAAAAGVTPSAISHRLDRAVDALRKHLSKLGCVGLTASLVTLLDAEHASAAVPPTLTAKLASIGLSGVGPRPARLRAALATTSFAAGIGLMIVGVWIASRPSALTAPSPVAPPVVATDVEGLTVTSGNGGLRDAAVPPVWKPGVVPADAPLAGRVVDTAGRPIANATVMVMGSIGTEVKTDVDGRYVLPKLDAGQYRVGVEVDGYLPSSWNSEGAPSLVVSADTHARRDFVLTRGVRVTVNVFNSDHEPLPNAEVDAVLAGGETTTNNPPHRGREGSVVLTLPVSAQPARVLVVAEDHTPVQTTVTPDSVAHPQSIDVTLYQGHTIHGIALCADGKPAKGWRIAPQPTWWPIHRSLPLSFYADVDEAGRFTLNHVDAGPCGLQLTKPETNEIVDLGVFQLPRAGGGELHVSVPGFSPGSRPSLTGRITFSGPGGVPNYIDLQAIGQSAERTNRVLLINGTRNGDNMAEDLAANGLPFELKDLPPDTYHLSFSAVEMDAQFMDNVRVPGPPLHVELKIGGKPHLTGTVTGAGGRPVTHFAVRVKEVEHLGEGNNYGQEENWIQVANDSGRFDVELVGPGVYRAQVSADGYAWAWTSDGRVEHAGDKADVHVQLSAGSSLCGVVTDPAGKPVANAKVTPLSKATDIADRVPSFASDAGTVTTSADGTFLMDHLAAGQDSIRVQATGFARSIVTGVNVAEGSVTALATIQLRAGGKVQGTVYDKAGSPLANAAVEVQDDEDYHPFAQEHAAHLLARAVTDADGRYAVDHLPVQDVMAVIADDHRNNVCVQRQLLHPMEGRTARVDFGGPTSLTGRLLTRDKKPLGGIDLTLAFGDTNGPYYGYAKTDGDGRFDFRGIRAGNLSLSRSSDTGFNHTDVIGDIAVTGHDQDLGDVVEDVGGVMLHVSADNSQQLRDIGEVEIRRLHPHGWWDQTITWAKQDDPATDAWRAIDVPTGDLEAVVLSKPAWAVVARTSFTRAAGADLTTVNFQLKRTASTQPAEPPPDGRTTIYLRRFSADGVLDLRGPATVTADRQIVPAESQIDGGWSYRVSPGPCTIDATAAGGATRTQTVVIPNMTARNAVDPVDVFEDR